MPISDIIKRARTTHVNDEAFRNVLVNTIIQLYIQENPRELRELHEAIPMGVSRYHATEGAPARTAIRSSQQTIRSIYEQARNAVTNKQHFHSKYKAATGYHPIDIQ
jgi:hypothetical protein